MRTKFNTELELEYQNIFSFFTHNASQKKTPLFGDSGEKLYFRVHKNFCSTSICIAVIQKMKTLIIVYKIMVK